MLRKLFIATLLLLVSFSAFALDGAFAGIGAEANGNTRKGAAGAAGLSFGFDINRHIALGYKAAIGINFNTLANIDNSAFFRWYLPLPVRGLFLQADVGASLYFENGISTPYFLGGGALGYRFLFNNFYLEPYARGGYPFVWGAGLNLGIQIRNGNEKRDNEKRREKKEKIVVEETDENE